MEIKIENMKSNNGREVSNQFIITTNQGQYFQSYQSVIAFWPNHLRPKDRVDGSNRIDAFYRLMGGKSLNHYGISDYPKIYLDVNYWDYSKTTSQYRNRFLNETTKETQAKIDSGKYLLVDLN